MSTVEHVEAHMEAILRAVAGLTYKDAMLVETALCAGWMTDDERARLALLADAFKRLSHG